MTAREAAVLPAPLTPPDCDLQDFKFMPLDVARLRDSDMASEQTPEENWAAVLLWAAAWHQVPAGSMPDSDNWIAKAAGYLSRGRIDPHWKDVKDGAMRGFVLCSDGRWYHSVVCEKANESWIGKLKQRLKTECARIKKHNDRHGTKIPFPEFEAWFSAGCPVGQPLPVPKDITPLSQGTDDDVPGDIPPLSLDDHHDVPGETPSKGQGEGQRQGQGELKAEALGHRASTQPELRANCEPTDAGQLSVAMRRFGITSNPGDLRLIALAEQGVSTETVTAACEAAKKAKPNESIPPAYVFSILERWAKEAAELNATGAAQPGTTSTLTKAGQATARNMEAWLERKRREQEQKHG
jgi:hypothetical protein